MMSAAHTTAAQRGLWRRSGVTLLTLVAAASLALGTPGATALAADPNTQSDTGTGQATLTPSEQRIENVVAAATQYLGVPYRVGSEGPSLFDCSGLVFRAFSDTGLVDRIGGARLRAAGYMRWFASRGLMTTDESQAQRGDLVIYNNGSHIGIYLGDGRAISALVTGVTTHSLHGISLPVTGFLRPDWSGNGKVAPFVPVNLPDVPEAPASLVPGADWIPALDANVVGPATREGRERTDLRTVSSRTFENADGTFTTEFHAQPIFYQPSGTSKAADLKPIDLTFVADRKTGHPTVASSPVMVTTRPANDAAGFVTAASADHSVSLSLAAGMASSRSTPQILNAGRVADFFGFQPQGIGLRVLAQPDGFKSFLVMAREPAGREFSFALDAPGLLPVIADDGSVILNDANGVTVGRIPRPLLLDSSDIDGNGGGVFTSAAELSLDTSGKSPVLTVRIDRASLDEAVFPAYLDLSLTDFAQPAAGADLAFVSSAHPRANLQDFQRPESAGFNELWLGHQPNSRNNNEVYVRFSGLAAVLGTVDVASASLELLPYFQRANDGVTIVRRVTAAWDRDTITWLTKPATDAADGLTVKSSAAAWTSLDVSGYVADVLSRGQPDYGLVLSGDETRTGTWKRLAASDAGPEAQLGPRLVVTWSGLRPNPSAVTSAPGSAMPTLSWTQPQLGAVQTRFQVQLSRDDFSTTDATSATVKGKAGAATQWVVPEGALSTSGSYAWRVRVQYGTDRSWSPWSSPQSLDVILPAHFRIDPHSSSI